MHCYNQGNYGENNDIIKKKTEKNITKIMKKKRNLKLSGYRTKKEAGRKENDEEGYNS